MNIRRLLFHLFLLAPVSISAQCDITDGMLIELQSTTAIDGLLRGSSGCVVGTTVGAPLSFSGGTLTLGQNGATTGQVLQWNGSAWVPATVLTAEVDGSITNEGVLGVGSGGSNDALLTSNTSTAAGVTIAGAGIVAVSESTSANGGTITITGTEVDGSVTNEGGLSVGAGGANTSTIVSNTSGSTPVTVSGSNTVTVTESGSTITIQADTSLLATVNDLRRFERFYFSTTAPADTNYLWAKLNSSPWKLDSVFAYEFGSWHIEGFYDRISGIFSKKPPLFVVATGQSNMLGIDGGGDTTTDRRLVAWDTTAHVWKVANLGVNPFNSTGANSIAFAFGKEVARRENRIVRLVVIAKSSQHIAQWFGVGGHAYNTNMNVLQAGMPRCDVLLWHQGESNHDGAGGVCNGNTCYTDSLYAIIRQFRGYTWADENTLFIAGGLYDGAGATQNDRNTALMGLNSDTISTTGFAYATDLDDSGDAVHFSGPALVTLGSERYYNVYRALPNVHNHEIGTGGGSVSIPANEIPYGNGSGLTSTSTFVYNSGKVGINNASPAQELDVTGDVLIRGSERINAVGDSTPFIIKMPSSFANSTSAWQVWNSAGSTLLARFTRTSSGNNMLLNNSTSTLTGSQNVAFGPNALNSITSAVDNVGMGYRSGEAILGGTKNLCIGTLAGLVVSSGFSNVLLGYGTGAAITTGFQNICIGTQAGVSMGSGASANIFIGTQAGQNNTGNDNTFIGHLSGQNTGSGATNTYIGQTAGRNTTGSRNVYLGAGNSPTVTESDALRIETSTGTPLISGDFSSNEVGINTLPASIARAFHVTGEVRITDLDTDTGTKVVLADADGDLDAVTPSDEFALSGSAITTNFGTAISPSQLTAMTNNWNPTGLSTAWIIRVDGDAAFQIISGITAPTTNKRLALWNVGSNAVLLPTENQSSSAANRFSFGRDVVLFPGKVVEIVYDLTSARWRLYSQGGLYDDVQHLYLNESFNAPVSGTGGDYSFWDITSPSVTSTLPVSGRWSGISVNTGSSASGNGYVASKDVYFEFSTSSGTATWAYCKAVIKTPASLSDASNDYTIRVGFNAGTAGGGASDGMYFDYNHSISSGAWSCATTNAGNTQRNSSGVTVATSTVYVLEVVCRPNLSVEFFVNGTRVATNDTWIPTGDDLICMAEIEKSVGTTQRDITVYTLQTSIALVK